MTFRLNPTDPTDPMAVDTAMQSLNKITRHLHRLSQVTDASASHTVTDPADAPVDADALRDDLVANALAEITAALDALGAKINEIIATMS